MIPSASVSSLAFEKIPHQPEVFLRYLGRSPVVLPFYRHPPELGAVARAAQTAAGGTFPREEMAGILRSQNDHFGGSDAVMQAIADLSQPGSVAVLTGQQVGLFTGPVLAIYKALTALRLTDHLRRAGFRAAAVFWMASDDHDLEEVTRLAMRAPGAGVGWVDGRAVLFGPGEMPPRPVGSIRMPESVSILLAQYVSSLTGDHAEEIKGMLASGVLPGRTFAESFGSLMAQMLQRRGLILFDPRDKGAKRLAAPVIQTALADAPLLRSRLLERSQALSRAGLIPQVAVLPRSTPVFLEENGERRLLLTEGGGFALKDTEKGFTLDQLLERAAVRPEDFSPNALLRPVVQDHLFPTAAYVGGPAEISYFAQAEVLYREFGRNMPVIWPRSSFTVLGAETLAAMQRHALRLEDCFAGEEPVVRMIGEGRPGSSAATLAGLRRRVNEAVGRLGASLTPLDPTLGPAADTIRRKLLHRLSSLEIRLLHLELGRNPQLRQEVRDVLDRCYPAGTLQERVVGVHSLLARHGLPLLDQLYGLIQFDGFEHRIVGFGAGTQL